MTMVVYTGEVAGTRSKGKPARQVSNIRGKTRPERKLDHAAREPL